MMEFSNLYGLLGPQLPGASSDFMDEHIRLAVVEITSRIGVLKDQHVWDSQEGFGEFYFDDITGKVIQSVGKVVVDGNCLPKLDHCQSNLMGWVPNGDIGITVINYPFQDGCKNVSCELAYSVTMDICTIPDIIGNNFQMAIIKMVLASTSDVPNTDWHKLRRNASALTREADKLIESARFRLFSRQNAAIRTNHGELAWLGADTNSRLAMGGCYGVGMWHGIGGNYAC